MSSSSSSLPVQTTGRRWWPKLKFALVASALLLGAALLVALVWTSRFEWQLRLFFHSRPLPRDLTLYWYQLRQYAVEERYFAVPGGRLHGLMFYASGKQRQRSSKGLVFLCKGSLANVKGYGRYAQLFCQEGYDVCMFDHRGDGKSDRPSCDVTLSEQLLIDDSACVYRQATPGYQTVIIYGQCITAFVAAHLALLFHNPWLVLENPCSDIVTFLAHNTSSCVFPQWLLRRFVKLRFDCRSALVQRAREHPLYLLTTSNDAVIPRECGAEVCKKSMHNLRAYDLGALGHNFLLQHEAYHQTVAAVLVRIKQDEAIAMRRR
jgi:hypothetical protein